MTEPAATEPAATGSGTLPGPAPGSMESPAAVHQVRRRDPAPLGAGVCVAAVGALVLAAMNGSYLGLTVTTGICYAIVTVGMVLQLGYSRQLAFSQSVFMGLGAYGTGVLETKYNFSSLESLLAVIGLALVTSLLIGAVVTRAPGLALAGYLRGAGAVEMSVNIGPFEELSALDHRAEDRFIDKKIFPAILFHPTRCACSV